ncbi:hypothetical protein K4F52_003701 [Lecanicillium sp. MT-2017a]|nr:hypothetical protein K4F52_003701 [Lecanicillium sp. MT-2017a]
MSSIGPQMPSQASSKRKRTPESDSPITHGPAPPSPSKQARRDDTAANDQANNADEINLSDSDSDDDYGPRAPGAAAPASKPSSGPTLPNNTDEIDLSSDSDTGRAPPAEPQPQPQAQPAPAANSDSDSEDDYGPALPGSKAAASRRGPIGPSLPPTEAAPTRDEWMLAPPTSTGYTERDPTKLRARKFASKTSSTAGEGVSSIWTETPEEKLRRLQDSVLGRGGDSDGDGGGGQQGKASSTSAAAQQEEERNRKIAATLEGRRGKSMYEEHNDQKRKAAGGKADEEEDDPSKRAFDKEKDMALSSKIGTAQRRELVNKSANFGGRFQKGSYL